MVERVSWGVQPPSVTPQGDVSMGAPTTNLHFDRCAVPDVAAALPLYSAKEFQSPTRSTIPLLSLLRHGHATFDALLSATGMGADSALHLEHRVSPPGGRGKASHTDLMVRCGNRSLAVEAKWTEPRYDTVETWLAAGSSPGNRAAVLDGWLGLLAPHTSGTPAQAGFSAVVYQLIHRAASACHLAEEPNLAYVHFVAPSVHGGATTADYVQDMHDLRSALGNPPSFAFYVVEVPISPTAAYAAIASLPKASPATAAAVQAAIASTALFTFGPARIIRVKP